MIIERLRAGWVELRRYPSALMGLGIIAGLLMLALYTVIAIPYPQALEAWRGGEAWRMHPVNAEPLWLDRLKGGDAPSTLIIEHDAEEVEETMFTGGRRLRIPLAFDFGYADFPGEMNLFLRAEDHAEAPFARLSWLTPDGRDISLGGHRLQPRHRVSISQDRELTRRLGGLAPHIGLFADPASDAVPEVLPGRYRLVLDVVVFDEQADIDATLVVYGRVHGIAGTDHQRRELSLALMWGTPVALAFGLIAAVGTTLTTLVIAAMGVWYRGWVDALIQRLTEVNMILPLLPILVMVGTLYSTSIWLMLGVVVVLGIFSAGIKTYRAMLLPIREAPYIEAARAYGASDMRIVLRYMIPRILPVLIPTFVTLIPTFVFLEASLAVLGLGDPVLPTWGKVLNDAQTQSALYNGYTYWVVAPALLLMLTGLGFAMLGFAMDRVFNPRLRNL
ncbi:ABC transporter permease [Halomonas urumqiensis]|uniref:ABC transporter permease n=1 Tax=Halomonas urumqiensis TaxID=1684789 RepID=A0A2N7UQV5_9GAMM|nr:ABC transporter permease [Halomonas urumqiensis]PMR82805.1 ABC transporter permease [Halomonas urumqiensis]PTB01876.1 ABC transporter permease [Halomonas urumqiensis]GHE21980.1 peptide ABC transporter permease [Halomonas urumqiensis]